MDISLNQQKSIFRIIKEAFQVYLKNFLPLTKVMIYPIVAHLIGIPYIILSTYFLMDCIDPHIFVKYFNWIAIGVFAISIPGFALFLNGFWAYLIAMVSLNKYTKAIINKENDVTTKSCANYVKGKKKIYAYVLGLMMVLWIVGLIIPVIPLFLTIIPVYLTVIASVLTSIVCLILLLYLSVYFSLSFQVLAFEEQGTIDVFKRSFELIDKNFIRTAFLMIVLYIITGVICPLIIHVLFEITGIVGLLASQLNGVSERILNDFGAYFQMIGIEGFQSLLIFVENPVAEVSKSIVILTIDGIVTAGMLPLGTICFTLLYFDILTKKQPQETSDNV